MRRARLPRSNSTAVKEAQAASGAGLVLLIPQRFIPAYAHLRAAIMQGQLGDISQAMIMNSQKVTATPRTQAFYATRTHGGILTKLAVHDLDLLRWIGGEVTVTRCSDTVSWPYRAPGV